MLRLTETCIQHFGGIHLQGTYWVYITSDFLYTNYNYNIYIYQVFQIIFVCLSVRAYVRLSVYKSFSVCPSVRSSENFFTFSPKQLVTIGVCVCGGGGFKIDI